ncbi:MAG: hypothetical protein KJ804_08920 [Proteobacteria bacterium]|nr:hypothetical protein [Pseudomonadota bacterium]MBU1058420.1 hypothetical protein [Pseudomonadota bacterium]
MDQRKITLAGVLVPDQWKGNGDISGFALFTNDEKKYILSYSDREKDLMPLLRQEIEISGFLESKAQEKIIFVTCFRPCASRKQFDLQAI